MLGPLNVLSRAVMKALRVARRSVVWPAINAARKRRLPRLGVKAHLGCGEDRLPGYLNIDCRYTPAVDVALDLNKLVLPSGSCERVYSHAFFVHLYRDRRLAHLIGVRRALSAEGTVLYIGLPYFRNVALYYLAGGSGVTRPKFDLFEVYRYTHGSPEQAHGWWIAQLHKSLFDEHEIAGLLNAAGFGSFAVFCYAYPGEPTDLRVTMGFFAMPASRRAGHGGVEEQCREALAEHPTRVIEDSLQFLQCWPTSPQ